MTTTITAPEKSLLPQELHREIEQFIFKEALFADESKYSEWEALLDDDMLYWIPLGDGDYDRGSRMSIAADNRARVATRIRQLNTGTHHAQTPPSPMRRMLSNVETYQDGPEEFRAYANFVLYELRSQSNFKLQVWCGRYEYRFRRRNRELKMFYKKISLVNKEMPLPSIAFII